METELINALKQAYESSGLWGAVAVGVMMSVRVYRLEFLQALLPERMKWENIPTKIAQFIVFITALGGAMLAALLTGTGWLPALMAAAPVALSAIGLHKASQAAGVVLDSKLQKKVQVSDRPTAVDNPTWRKMISIAIPYAPPKREN